MDEEKNGCEVCFHDFDNRERRPKVVPCGHTFCSICVCDYFKENLLLCPICRSEHKADSAADFPINFKLESVLFKGILIPLTHDISNLSSDEPKSLSNKLKSIAVELCSGMENKATNNKEVRSQLHQYENLLSEKEIAHHHIKEIHSAITQRNDDILQIIKKERARIAEALKEEEEETCRMKIVRDKLYGATTPQEVLLSMEDATICHDFLEGWNQETQKIFPNIQLLTKSVMLCEQSQILLQTLPDNRGDAAAEESTEVKQRGPLSENMMASPSAHSVETSSESPNEIDSPEESSLLIPKLSIQEKIRSVLEKVSCSNQTKTPVTNIDQSVQKEENIAAIELVSKEIQTEESCQLMSFGINEFWYKLYEYIFGKKSSPLPKEISYDSQIESLRTRSGSVMEMIHQNRLFAVHEIEGRRRYAQISLQNNRILLHHLKDQHIPTNAHLLQHNDVLKLVNVSSRLVFLEVRITYTYRRITLGKLFIRLSADGKRAQQFALLCSGQKGPSYVESSLLKVYNRDQIHESFLFGDYEKLGGKGGRALVPEVLKEEGGRFKRPCVAGTVQGYMSSISEAIAAQFFIYTGNIPGNELECCFGMVEEGLPILLNDVKSYSDYIIFSDAGLVLDI